jgi:hypothetical protein
VLPVRSDLIYKLFVDLMFPSTAIGKAPAPSNGWWCVAKPRLGIGFEHILYAGSFAAADRPSHGVGPTSGAIERLVRMVPQLDIVVYPLRPAPRRATHIASWLVTELYRHFGRADVPELQKTVDATMDLIEIVDRRPDDLDAVIEYWALQFETIEGLEPTVIAENMGRIWARGGR